MLWLRGKPLVSFCVSFLCTFLSALALAIADESEKDGDDNDNTVSQSVSHIENVVFLFLVFLFLLNTIQLPDFWVGSRIFIFCPLMLSGGVLLLFLSSLCCLSLVY